MNHGLIDVSMRDEALIRLRPVLKLENPIQPLAPFQEVLRSVLKLQNPLFVQFSKHFLSNKYKGYMQRDDAVKLELLHQSLKKDIPFKKTLIGLVVGMFTETEMAFYLENEQEINKRLIEFLYKRLSSQMI
ncbi:MAG: hypothetical protein IE931_07760 [Sphingobacteriales bacterium]|nr:hypothetical protein [Sphingobacteriales bacterium]